MTTPNHAALARAIKEAETQAGLAKLIGVRQSHVEYWLNKSKRGVPAEMAGRIEAATGVPRHELRPDVFAPPVEATQPARASA